MGSLMLIKRVMCMNEKVQVTASFLEITADWRKMPCWSYFFLRREDCGIAAWKDSIVGDRARFSGLYMGFRWPLGGLSCLCKILKATREKP